MSVAPLVIEIVLHYHACHGDFPRLSAPACREAVAWLKEEGLLDGGSPEVYRITPKGSAWVQMLCATPFPEVAMLDPRTGERVS